MHCLNMRSAGISVSAAAYCRQIDIITAARSSAAPGPVCPWTAVPATTHVNAATALANQAHFGAAECARARTGLCHRGTAVTWAAASCVPFATLDHITHPTRLARAHRAVGIDAPADVTPQHRAIQPSPNPLRRARGCVASSARLGNQPFLRKPATVPDR